MEYDTLMFHIITRILIFIATLSLTTLMVYSTFEFNVKKLDDGLELSEKKIDVFLGKILNSDWEYTLQKEKTASQQLSLWQDQFLSVEFGRLSSAMFTSPTKEIETNILTLTGNEIIPRKDYPAIISLYDPFMSYNLRSTENDYLIHQITNGSFYVWRETDGTVSVYSIDAVIRLDFLDKWNFMTDMMLFPGMYIRFDPKLNRNLAEADLFRIILSMVSDTGDSGEIERTWVEFVNPRISSDADSDTFFMYRLPQFTRVLFRSLHAEFSARVKKLEDLKKYASDFEYDIGTEKSDKLSNPTKKNHFLLRELEWLLSQIVNSQKTKEQFAQQLARITEESKSLAKWNSVEKTLEDFLTDARFASFWTANNAHFQEIYNEIAQNLNIAPTNAKTKLLQRLSNIYSLNLSIQLKDSEFSRIDTYTPTASELLNTLNSDEIEKKDYFDIALYAFHVLKKAEEGSKYFDEAVTIDATYNLLTTIFLATDNYVKSVKDTKLAYKSLSIQFYDHILETLVNSLYIYFMKDDGERLYFNDRFVQNDTIKIEAKNFIDRVTSFDVTVSHLFDSIARAYENETDLRTFLNIKKSKIRLHAFVTLLKKWAYSEYVLSPYYSVKLNGISLPKMSEDGESVIQESLAIQWGGEIEIPEDKWIIGIRNLLWNIPITNIVREGEYYQVHEAELQGVNPYNGVTINYRFSATFSTDLKTINNIVILYSGRVINIVTDTKDQQIITQLSQVLPNYFVSIDNIYEANQSQVLSWDIRLYLDKAKIAIGKNIFPL